MYLVGAGVIMAYGWYKLVIGIREAKYVTPHTSPRALAASPRAWSNKRRSSRGQELTRKQRIRPRKELVEDPPPPRPPGRGGSRPGAPVPRGPEAGEGAPGREHEGLPQRPVRPSPPLYFPPPCCVACFAYCSASSSAGLRVSIEANGSSFVRPTFAATPGTVSK